MAVRPTVWVQSHKQQIPCLVLQEAGVYLCESDVAYNEGGAMRPCWSHDNASVRLITVLWACRSRLTTRHRGRVTAQDNYSLNHSFWIILF